MAERIWSEQQHRIFHWFKFSEIEIPMPPTDKSAYATFKHLVVRARAGTGKTTTILEAINYAPETSILLAAFNKRIADHLKDKLQNPNAEAKTLHAIGFGFIRERWGRDVRVADWDERADDLTRQAAEALGSVDVPIPVLRLISKLNGKARELTPHATEPDQIEYLAAQYECEPDEEYEEMGFDTAFVVQHALKAMALGMARPKPHPESGYGGGIDYADMIFLPIRNKWLRPRYELVVVDEAQDMAAAQLELAQGICSGRICVVGDDRQAIYGFRGADSNSIDRLRQHLKAGELGLTTTYRCGKAITRHAARLVPDFQHADSNGEGIIRLINTREKLVEAAGPGDYVLSRKNAALAAVAMALIRANKRVCILGKDIGKGLEALAKKLATGAAERSIPMFLQKLQTWKEKEGKRAMRGAKNEQAGMAKVEQINDKAETLAFLCDGVTGIRELLVRIQTLFSDVDKTHTLVTCSSIHKAKGLEADRVFVLVDTLYALRRGKVDPARFREEQNLDYVACTRAISELVLFSEKYQADATYAVTAMQSPLADLTAVGEDRSKEYATDAAVDRIGDALGGFEPHTEQDIDDKAEFDALAAAVHEIEGAK